MTIENQHGQLHQELIKLVKMERRITSQILDLLQRVEDDKAYLPWGYSNLFGSL